MHVLVVFHTVTGRTEALAKAVAEGVAEVDGIIPMCKAAKDVAPEDFKQAQGIIAGSPVYYGSMAAELKAVFERFVGLRPFLANKVGAAFATGGNQAGGKETTMLSILQAMLINGMIVVGDPLEASGHYGVSCTGAPDPATLADGAKLGKRVASLVRLLYA